MKNSDCPERKEAIRKFFPYCLVTLLTALILWPAISGAAVQGSGLILPTEEELRGVPLADLPFSGMEIPTHVDLSPDLPPPGAQGKQNSCVGWALAYALKSYQERKEENHSLVGPDGGPNLQTVFSPAFIYNQTNNGRDAGVHIHVALNFLQDHGVCALADMPYNQRDFRSRPSQQAQEKAKRYRINTWRRVNVQSTKEVQTHIQAGYPVVIGAMFDQEFARFDHPQGWIWKERSGKILGAHAMLVTGYDDQRHAFKVINSWGRSWGDGGYGWIDYDHFRRVVRVGYVVMDARNGAPSNAAEKTPVRPNPRKAETETVASQTGLRFGVTNIIHNATLPNRPDLGGFLRIDGYLQIPANAGRSNQVVIHFYTSQPDGSAGVPVPSNILQYSDARGNSACGTAVYPIPATGLNTTFAAWISNAAFKLPVGQWTQRGAMLQYQPRRSYLVGIPTLFVDNFGVAAGQPLYFYMDR